MVIPRNSGKTQFIMPKIWHAVPFEVNASITSGCSKRPLFSPARPRRAKTRLSASKAAARSATRRIMSVTSADGRPRLRREASESVSAQCLKGEAYSFSPTRPELLLAAHARWYVEPLSDARTLLADFFSILLRPR
ncbi:MAG: hypothetical protein OJF51_003520 [Nitrospira sp.]|nr:MAG: hypothetical protein OJF51_003520 [Nitrospira sp.]